MPTLAGPTTLPTRLRVPLKRYDDYLRIARRGLEAVPDLSLAPSNEEADRQASRITNTLQLAAEAVGSKHCNAKAWPWWDDECKEARARAASGQREARAAYRALLGRKRKEY